MRISFLSNFQEFATNAKDVFIQELNFSKTNSKLIEVHMNES